MDLKKDMILFHPVLVKEAKQEQMIGMVSDILDAQEIATNTSNLHLTSKVKSNMTAHYRDIQKHCPNLLEA